MSVQSPKKVVLPVQGVSLIEMLGFKRHPRHTMVLPLCPELLDWFEGQFEDKLRRMCGESVSHRELEPFIIGRPRRTTVLIQVTGYPALQTMDPADVLKVADSKELRCARQVVGLSSRSSDSLVYGALDALSRKDGRKRPFGTYPCKNGDILWATELHEEELFVLVDVQVSLGSGVDRTLEAIAASRRS